VSKYSGYEFRNQPWFDQEHFEGFNQAIAMKTIVIHCFDPRASEIPHAVAQHFGDEVFPGKNILDEAGNRVGHTRTLFPVTNAGGRAAEALASVAIMEYLFTVQNVIVVHHSFCGATAFTPELIFNEFQNNHHVDLSRVFKEDDLVISDYEKSIHHDLTLLRSSPAVPKHVKLYGFFFEMNTGILTEIARDIPS
jgi:carbonic anhydrase